MIKRNYVLKTYKRIIITSFQPRKLDDFFYQIIKKWQQNELI